MQLNVHGFFCFGVILPLMTQWAVVYAPFPQIYDASIYSGVPRLVPPYSACPTPLADDANFKICPAFDPFQSAATSY